MIRETVCAAIDNLSFALLIDFIRFIPLVLIARLFSAVLLLCPLTSLSLVSSLFINLFFFFDWCQEKKNCCSVRAFLSLSPPPCEDRDTCRRSHFLSLTILLCVELLSVNTQHSTSLPRADLLCTVYFIRFLLFLFPSSRANS